MRGWKKRLIFLVGFILCCFPIISNLYKQYEQNQLIATYESAVGEEEDTLSQILEDAKEYNSHLYQSKGGILESKDLFSDEIYYSQLNLTGTGIMGSLEIPKINVNLPIYHGTDEETLADGVGHLQGTSLPVGGENTHSALSGHRGLPSSKLLVRLDEIEEGDYFFVKMGNEILAYKVFQVQTVEPEDTSKLDIEAGKDLVSIITCTPYGLNTHRLIVTGERVTYEESNYESIQEAIPSGREILLTIAPFVFLGLILVIHLVERQRWQYEDGKI